MIAEYFPNTVDKQEIDRAFIEYVSKTVQIDGQPLKAFVRKFDTDFKEVEKPCASIYVVGLNKDPVRQTPVPTELVLKRDVPTKTLTMQKSGTAVNFIYYLDFWADTQTDMNTMIEQWLIKNQFSSWFNLPVIDSAGEAQTLLCISKSSPVVQSEFEQNKEANNFRLFHTTFVYCIYTYYAGEVYDAPAIEEVKIMTEVMQSESKRN